MLGILDRARIANAIRATRLTDGKSNWNAAVDQVSLTIGRAIQLDDPSLDFQKWLDDCGVPR